MLTALDSALMNVVRFAEEDIVWLYHSTETHSFGVRGRIRRGSRVGETRMARLVRENGGAGGEDAR